jgi:uncharacterized protein YndB with AHSA1/START domain
MSGDSATVTVFVGVAPDKAFRVFTDEIDLWWRQGPRYRIAGRLRGQLNFESRLGGRLFETWESPSGARTFEVGRVTAWEPPSHLELEWRGANYRPHEKTLVDVRFEAARGGTSVTVRHSGFLGLPEDHPARHGLTGPAFSRMIGLWWGELMTSLRERIVSLSRP